MTEDGWLSGSELDACACRSFDEDRDGEVTRAEFLTGATGAAVPAEAEEPVTAEATHGPPLGRYVCHHIWWNVAQGRSIFDYKGYFELLPGKEYRWLDDGGTGRYVTDPTTGAPAWRSGPLAEKQPRETTYRLDGSTHEIVLAFEQPMEWQCTLESPGH